MQPESVIAVQHQAQAQLRPGLGQAPQGTVDDRRTSGADPRPVVEVVYHRAQTPVVPTGPVRLRRPALEAPYLDDAGVAQTPTTSPSPLSPVKEEATTSRRDRLPLLDL